MTTYEIIEQIEALSKVAIDRVGNKYIVVENLATKAELILDKFQVEKLIAEFTELKDRMEY